MNPLYKLFFITTSLTVFSLSNAETPFSFNSGSTGADGDLNLSCPSADTEHVIHHRRSQLYP